jgi:hypothetical protein
MPPGMFWKAGSFSRRAVRLENGLEQIGRTEPRLYVRQEINTAMLYCGHVEGQYTADSYWNGEGS